jgi:hypothetical protein
MKRRVPVKVRRVSCSGTVFARDDADERGGAPRLATEALGGIQGGMKR